MAVKQKHREREFLLLMKEADSRYFAEIAARRTDPERFAAPRKGRHLMKKIGKLAIIGAAAAVLLTAGGITAMVAMRGQNHDTSDTSGFDSSLPEGTERAFHLNLTDQQWDPANRACYTPFSVWFTLSEDGIYHNYREVFVPSDDKYDDVFWNAVNAYKQSHSPAGSGHSASESVSFTAAGQTEHLPLCARPNCLHDGNEYCEATTKQYNHSALTYWDGVLYAAATRLPGSDAGDRTKTGAYLLAYAPDGTGLDIACDFGIDSAGIDCAPIVHRGYVWCVFSKQIFNTAGGTCRSGYVIVGYELATGKTVEVCSQMPEEGKENLAAPSALTAWGDKLIYTQMIGTWPSENTKGIFAVDLTTGKHEKLTRLYGGPIAVAGDQIFYWDSISSEKNLMVYDLKTGESREGMRWRSNYFVSDGEHLIFVGMDPVNYDSKDPYDAVSIYDLDGKLLGSLKLPEHRYRGDIAVYGDDIYVITNGALEPTESGSISTSIYATHKDDVILHCSKSALLEGKAEWTTAATVQHRVEIDMEAWRGAHTETTAAP